MKLFLYLLFTLFCSKQTLSQYKIKDSCSAFTLNINAKNLQSYTIKLLYSDCDKTRDTIIILSNGKATITGKINRASQAILFADIKNGWFDAPSVVRFIIEPTNMILRFTMVNDTAGNVEIEGSYSQNQKVAWEADHTSLLKTRDINENNLEELLRQKGIMDSIKFKKRLEVIGNKRDSLLKLVVIEALKYVKQNPHSYFSGYLLNHYKRSILTDTLETYFYNLDSKVINSDFGKNILDELFKLTDDWAFRQKFTDSATYESLKKINNIYDVSLPNLEGTETSFSEFKGNVLLIDFWASWCGPCIKNVPYLKKLITSMKNKPFKVISVSIESDKDAWQKSLKKYGFPGIHLFDDKGLLSTFYKVLWVPRYIIVKPDGTIANMDAPQAMESELKVLIDELLKK